MENELKQLLRENAVANSSRRRLAWRCASESKLAAFVDGNLEPAARKSLLDHLADCKSCLNQVAFLVQSREWVEFGEIPAALKAKARSLASEKRGSAIGFRWGWATAALASCLMIGFLVTLTIKLRSSVSSQPGQDQPRAQQSQIPAGVLPSSAPRNPDAVAIASPAQLVKPSLPKAQASAPVVRNAERESHLPTLLLPRDGAVVNFPVEIRWQAVTDAVSYDVSIINATGETVLVKRTAAAHLTLGSEIPIAGRARYFISVRAHLRDGQIVRSKPVSFRMSE